MAGLKKESIDLFCKGWWILYGMTQKLIQSTVIILQCQHQTVMFVRLYSVDAVRYISRKDLAK